MKLPHILIGNSRWPHRFGRLVGRPTFYAWTVFVWTFVDDNRISPKQKRHEYQHVVQWAAGWLIGLVIWLVLLPGWVLILTPFTFNALYVFAMFVAWLAGDHPYRDNLFERDARDAAGEL